MANEAMSQLETAIRRKASNDATLQFRKDWEAMSKPGWSVGTRPDGWTTEDSNQLKALGEKYLKYQIIPKAEEKAIREFIGSYEQLVHQFPSLVESTVDGIVHERETQHG